MFYLFEHLFLFLLIAFAVGMIVGWLRSESGKSASKGE